MLRASSFLRYLFLLLAVAMGSMAMIYAELTEEQKKEIFLNEQQSSSALQSENTKGEKAHSQSTPHSTHHHHSAGKSSHHAKSGSHSSESAVPHHSAKPLNTTDSGAMSLTSAVPAHPVETSELPIAHPQASSPPVTQATPASQVVPSDSISLPHGAAPSAPITIEKSGVESDQGVEPAPAQTASGGFFGWLFGSGGAGHSYTYLNGSTRAAIDHAPVRHGRWRYIIVHNSGTREGNARVFDIYHFRVRHMKNGLAYHFVIGNGHGSGDGQIEIGHRWTAQLNGGHVASDYLNDISLGICLVGDFNRDIPTQAQIGALEELIDYLRNRVGKSQGHRAIIYAHKEINPRPTDCPGDRFPYSWLHARFR